MSEISDQTGARIAVRADAFHRKSRRPSDAMHPADGRRYRCPWIEDSVTIHSDGNVTCGVDDPHAQRSFGNIKRQTLDEIRSNPEYARLRDNLFAGRRCIDCGLFQEIAQDHAVPALSASVRTLVIEPTISCNIRCINETCIINNDAAIILRESRHLSLRDFMILVDQLDDRLATVYFFNYGDPFVNAAAEDMLCYLKMRRPQAHVITSTNGIPLAKPERATKVVQSGLDFMVFTIGGVIQEHYVQYHVRGRVDLALRGMTNVLQARADIGASLPFVNWRYLLFRWNDSEAEIEQAIALATEHGVDEFSLYLTHVPEDGCSYRLSPGSPLFAKYRKYIANSLGYTARVGSVDADGLYAVETVGALGTARWMCWQAQQIVRGSDGWIHLSFATVRPAAADRQTYVFIVTPWRVIKAPIGYYGWNRFSIPIPAILRDFDTIKVSLVTEDYWFPAEETGTPDLRCLGCLVEQAVPLPGEEVQARWLRLEALPAPTAEETVRLSRFDYVAPEPLQDWQSGRMAVFDDAADDADDAAIAASDSSLPVLEPSSA